MRILLCTILICFVANAQQNNSSKKGLKYEGEIKGVFEIIKIDSTKKYNLITLKLKYLLNKDFINNTETPKEYIALLYSERKKNVKIGKLKNYDDLIIGREYYFDLKHLYFYKSMYPASNEIPYAFDIDGKRIWSENDSFGIYTSDYVFNLRYKN
jgi:hypothetical protein